MYVHMYIIVIYVYIYIYIYIYTHTRTYKICAFLISMSYIYERDDVIVVIDTYAVHQ